MPLSDYLENAAPALALRFEKVGDTHTFRMQEVEDRPSLDSDRNPITDKDGNGVIIPVATVEPKDHPDEVRSVYLKPAILSALASAAKRAKVPFDAIEGGSVYVTLTFSSEGPQANPKWSKPQRFSAELTPVK